MGTYFKRGTIKRKIIVIALVTSGLTLLFATLAFVANQVNSHQKQGQKNLSVVADMVAYTCSAPLMFIDVKAATEALSSLKANPDVIYAYVLNEKGTIFSSYRNADSNAEDHLIDRLKSSRSQHTTMQILNELQIGGIWNVFRDIYVIRPILADKQTLGHVVIRASSAQLQRTLFAGMWSSLLTLLAALVAAYFIASWLQTFITRPISSLARTMHQVSEDKDYSLRSDQVTDGEIGQLITGFNEMLSQIELRDNELAEYRDSLELAIARRTEELRQMVADLEIARDSAEAASRSKSEFLANMSHEIRTPMNGILGMAELMMGTNLSAKQQKFAEIIQNSGTSLLTIINDILDFSKIEAGKLVLEVIPFNLHEMVCEAVELFATTAEQKNIEMLVSIAPDVPVNVKSDPVRIRQILLNLISNSIKFTNQGEVVLSVTLMKHMQDDFTIRFAVNDTGIGIEEAFRQKIFDAFSQADGSMTRKYGGTGLGLTIAKQLTILLGGEIGVESTPGAGSCFWFTASMCRHSELLASASLENYENIQGTRVLIVDDNATNRTILEQQVASWGMAGDSASSGAEALVKLQNAARTTPFKVAILDMMMPEMDGISLARAIRSNSDIPPLNLVLLTSADMGEAALARDLGISYCLAKPIRSSWLYNCMIKMLCSKETPRNEHENHVKPHTVEALKGATILLVEDNVVNQLVGRGMLEDLGCTVTVADNGLDAVNLLAKAPYTAVFMDCQMPVMDGYEATRTIRERERAIGIATDAEKPHQIIIALTAHALEGDQKICLATGMDDYLTKPFTRDQLEKILLRFLSKNQLKAEPSGFGDSSPSELVPSATTPLALSSGSSYSERSEPCINRECLAGIRKLARGSNKNLLGNVIKHYLADSPRIMTVLRQAVNSSDPALIKMNAHYLKSSSVHLGALRLSELLKSLEHCGSSSSFEGAVDTFARIEEEFAMVAAELSVLVKEDGDAVFN